LLFDIHRLVDISDSSEDRLVEDYVLLLQLIAVDSKHLTFSQQTSSFVTCDVTNVNTSDYGSDNLAGVPGWLLSQLQSVLDCYTNCTGCEFQTAQSFIKIDPGNGFRIPRKFPRIQEQILFPVAWEWSMLCIGNGLCYHRLITLRLILRSSKFVKCVAVFTLDVSSCILEEKSRKPRHLD